MTKEDKELLLKDLCARLPYGVKCKVSYNSGAINDKDATLYSIDKDGFLMFDEIGGDHREFLCKPYLFPMSSMTDEQLMKFLNIRGLRMRGLDLSAFREGKLAIVSSIMSYERNMDWLNAHHFDYRNLIGRKLAIDATGLNIY